MPEIGNNATICHRIYEGRNSDYIEVRSEKQNLHSESPADYSSFYLDSHYFI